ncbi:XdhC family protein [Methylophaga pinxianii]|uniref:XdhC family protein n=1 Tax=Methylophaga pinxianii TaxID=2881052 RepID=UPI001CF1832B|nr:XdhC family protein [Methylophaga pinxianii]MCB2428203.1 XdhC family protein [Methylophaga pinxianii]UPH45911.1 XdhC family protein [Methylophaga pinxianii]
MDSVDLSVFKTLEKWLEADLTVWLVTVVKTFGSSPRQPGAMLVLRDDGVLVGSVSGGCIEDDLADKARSGELSTARAVLKVYGMTQEEAQRFNLPCGGTLELVIEPVKSLEWVSEIRNAINSHRLIKRELNLASLQSHCSDARSTDIPIQFTEQHLSIVYGPRWRILIIGAGQTSVYLADMAKALDYQVTVCEPRDAMRASWEIKEVTLLNMMPDDAVMAMQPDAHTAIIALTHDPKLDDMALLEGLKSAAFYVGALGSQKNNANRRKRLAMFDLLTMEIERLHGPVGLSIGSRTPPEIAIAILAELIELRRNGIANKNSIKAEIPLVCS